MTIHESRLFPVKPGTPKLSEAELQAAVIETARTFGYRVAHFRPARTKHGWVTPVAADGKGFPDLCMAHPDGRLIFAELKSGRGHLSDEQQDWIRWLEAVQDAVGETVYKHDRPLRPFQVFVWTPEDWPERIVAVLSGKPVTVRGAA